MAGKGNFFATTHNRATKFKPNFSPPTSPWDSPLSEEEDELASPPRGYDDSLMEVEEEEDELTQEEQNLRVLAKKKMEQAIKDAAELRIKARQRAKSAPPFLDSKERRMSVRSSSTSSLESIEEDQNEPEENPRSPSARSPSWPRNQNVYL